MRFYHKKWDFINIINIFSKKMIFYQKKWNFIKKNNLKKLKKVGYVSNSMGY